MNPYPYAAAARRFTNRHDRETFAQSTMSHRTSSAATLFNHVARCALGPILPET